MVYRISQLEVSSDDPFRYDALGRRPLVEFLTGLIGRAGGPFVLALDSPWGTGKTTLVQMLEAELKRQNFSCIYFNAWKVDYVTDPLVALVSSIDTLKIDEKGADATFKEHLQKARRVTSLVAKRAAVAAAKALTVGALDLEVEIEAAAAELAGDSVNDIVEAFQKEGELLEKFKAELGGAVEQLGVAGKNPTLVFFVDEIDRCRPTFAVELLERIKHLFDVPNILFVLSLDKKQLSAGISAVYGQGINAAEYLRRFIDLEYVIPVVKTKRFVESLFARFQLDQMFERRTHPDLRHDRQNLIRFFSALADAAHLSLRTQERCMTRLRIVMDQTPPNQYLEPVLVAVLIMLRASEPDLFEKLKLGTAHSENVMNYLRGLPGGVEFLSDRIGTVIEGYLIAADENGDRRDSIIRMLTETSQAQNNPNSHHANEVLAMVKNAQRPFGELPGLSAFIGKIDLASGIRE